MNRLLVVLACLALLNGCAQVGYKEFYTQVAPSKYPATEQVKVFEYENVNLKDVYDTFYSDFLIVGRAGFNGPYEDPAGVVGFAKSIGADVVITTAQLQGTRTALIPLTTPTTTTTTFSGTVGTRPVNGTATTFGTTTTNVPITVNRYDQDALYLRNVNGVVPLWRRTSADYPRTGDGAQDGAWSNDNYRVNVVRSNGQNVGFIESVKGNGKGAPGQLKFLYGADTGTGVYLMQEGAPMPAKFAVNKFGHLEVKLLTGDDTFSFGR